MSLFCPNRNSGGPVHPPASENVQAVHSMRVLYAWRVASLSPSASPDPWESIEPPARRACLVYEQLSVNELALLHAFRDQGTVRALIPSEALRRQRSHHCACRAEGAGEPQPRWPRLRARDGRIKRAPLTAASNELMEPPMPILRWTRRQWLPQGGGVTKSLSFRRLRPLPQLRPTPAQPLRLLPFHRSAEGQHGLGPGNKVL